MDLRNFIIGFCFVLSINLCLGQSENFNSVKKVQDTSYIKRYRKSIATQLFLINTSNNFRFKSREEDLSFKMTPNKQDRFGVSVAFRSIVIGASFSPKFLAENRDNDNSKLFRLNINGIIKQWLQTVNIYYERGFYLEGDNTEVYLPNTNVFKIGGNTSYIFNKNFSFRALVAQYEKQTKSAGSFIPSALYYFTDINIESGDVEDNIKSYDFAISPSYFYNYVPAKNLLLSGGASAGIGINHTESKTESLSSLLTEFNFVATVVYDNDRFFAGGRYSYLILNHNVDRVTYIKDSIPFLKLFIGYRFGAPKAVLNTANDINEKIKF